MLVLEQKAQGLRNRVVHSVSKKLFIVRGMFMGSVLSIV